MTLDCFSTRPVPMETVEEGKAGLPFEILLRLASFYARNDPIPFVMKYARTYSPGIWDVMETFKFPFGTFAYICTVYSRIMQHIAHNTVYAP